MTPRRHSVSKVDKLPDPIRQQVARLIAANVTLDEIVAQLKQLEADSGIAFDMPSRSGLGRYAERLRAAQDRIKRSRAMGEAFGQVLGDNPDEVSRANIQMLQTMIMELMTAVEETDEGETRSVLYAAKDVEKLAKSLQMLAAAQKTDQERYLKAKAEFAKEAAARVDAVADAEGWTPDTKKRVWDAMIGGDKA